MKQDLKDVTFTIPVKIDSKDRARNLFIMVNYITRNFDTNFIIAEQDGEYVPQILKDIEFKYIKTNTDKGTIHRTQQLNMMAEKSNTSIIANYDCDVLFEINAYITTINLIRSNEYEMVYPYNGMFLNVEVEDINNFSKTYDITPLLSKQLRHLGAPDKPSLGGAIFYNRLKFIEYGMENEHFIGWGFEDDERFYRFKTLGMKIYRTSNSLYHMSHFSSSYNPQYITHNQNEMLRIQNMDKDQLKEEISKWEWNKLI